MTITNDDDVKITIEFDEAVKAIAYLSALLNFLKDHGAEKETDIKHIETAKEICEAFCCEHFQEELSDG